MIFIEDGERSSSNENVCREWQSRERCRCSSCSSFFLFTKIIWSHPSLSLAKENRALSINPPGRAVASWSQILASRGGNSPRRRTMTSELVWVGRSVRTKCFVMCLQNDGGTATKWVQRELAPDILYESCFSLTDKSSYRQKCFLWHTCTNTRTKRSVSATKYSTNRLQISRCGARTAGRASRRYATGCDQFYTYGDEWRNNERKMRRGHDVIRISIDNVRLLGLCSKSLHSS